MSLRTLFSSIAFAAILASPANAATFHVDSTLDQVDASPGDGVCRTIAKTCTLRAAVMEANTQPGNFVVLPAGRFKLTIPPKINAILPAGTESDPLADDPSAGDLNVERGMTISGAGARRTIIDANHSDRAFNTRGSATITDVALINGVAVDHNAIPTFSGGGAIGNFGNLRIERVAIKNNIGGFGGGIFSVPLSTLTVIDSTISGNVAGEAGGIRFDQSGVMINSTVSGNKVYNFHELNRPVGLAGKGGGIDARGPGVTITNSTIANNSTSDGGGAINISLAYDDVLPAYLTAPLKNVSIGQITLKNSIVADNKSLNGPRNCMATMAKFVSSGHNIDDDGTCGLTGLGDRPSTKPKLGKLRNNGGPTDTMAPGKGSLAIGGGSGCPAADQRGHHRRAGFCDIGAYQRR